MRNLPPDEQDALLAELRDMLPQNGKTEIYEYVSGTNGENDSIKIFLSPGGEGFESLSKLFFYYGYISVQRGSFTWMTLHLQDADDFATKMDKWKDKPIQYERFRKKYENARFRDKIVLK